MLEKKGCVLRLCGCIGIIEGCFLAEVMLTEVCWCCIFICGC